MAAKRQRSFALSEADLAAIGSHGFARSVRSTI
jgi:hypothetical protein